MNKKEVTIFILIGTLLELLKWLPLSGELYNALYDTINLSIYSTMFLVYFAIRYRSMLVYMALFNRFLEQMFIFNDILYIDKYDMIFEHIHLTVLFCIIYKCILDIKREF